MESGPALARPGPDVPVFLHPTTKEEYALARTERKVGRGHRGFVCDANISVTLEQDLLRRDLTVNALAEAADGKLIDPYGGRRDLENRLLRHVSAAFEEDPLRILRLARFASRFQDFSVHGDTIALMKTMVQRGDLGELAAERIYAEFNKALSTSHPLRFFEIVTLVGAHEKLWPGINDQGLTMLQQVANRTDNKVFRFSALLFSAEDSQLDSMAKSLRLPKQLIDFTRLSNHAYNAWKQLETSDGKYIVDWFYEIDAFRRRDRFEQLNDFFSLISRIESATDHSFKWRDHYATACSISAREMMENYSGKELGLALRNRQQQAIEERLSK